MGTGADRARVQRAARSLTVPAGYPIRSIVPCFRQIADLTDPALAGTMVMMDGTSYWHAAYTPEIDGVRGFCDFVSRRDVETAFEVYDVIERSRDEAIVVCNKMVSIRNADVPPAG
jgi:hypothetical protein